MSLTQRMHFLKDVFQMITIALISAMDHYHINELYLFRDTLYMYKLDSALNNLQWLMCHKTKQNKTNSLNTFTMSRMGHKVDF